MPSQELTRATNPKLDATSNEQRNKRQRERYATDPVYQQKIRDKTAARQKTLRGTIKARLWQINSGARREGYSECLADVDEILAAFSGECGICHSHDKDLVIDHDHKTGKFRGWLCAWCNSGLGYFEDNTIAIHNACAYLSVPNAIAKDANPKDAIGAEKAPIHLWPSAATALGAFGLLDGALKYGRANWRSAGIRASVYYDAIHRHLAKWFEGEDTDTDSGLPHEAHILACIAIIVDAKQSGKFIDDRQFNGSYFPKFLAEMTTHVKRLKAKHQGQNPKHYTITDKR